MTMLDLSDVARVHFRLIESGEDHPAPKFDYTTLNSISECPTWGIVRYVLHKTTSEPDRAMALEAGEALHDVFAAIRLTDLLRETGDDGLFLYHTEKLFGDRSERMLHYLFSQEDERTRVLNFALEALASSGFVDDPRDKKRTMTHLEESAIAYYDRWSRNRGEHSTIWLDRTTQRIGVEMPFSLLITFTGKDGDTLELQFIGRMDGLHVGKGGTIIVHENKTAARLDDAWLAGMRMSHQVTGYTVAAALTTQIPCGEAYVHGLSIPLPKDYDLGGVVREKVVRTDRAIKDWLNWLIHVYGLIVRYKDKPISAPRYTRACNRYFRPCPFLALCDVQDEGEFHSVLRDMPINKWSPLDD